MEDRDINKILGNGAADCIELANAAFEEIMKLEDEPIIGGIAAKRAIQIAGNARRAITDKLVEMHRAIKPQTN